MIRPTAAERRRLKHERYLREIREKNLAIENTAFLIDSVQNFNPEDRLNMTDMSFDEIMAALRTHDDKRDAKIVAMIAQTIADDLESNLYDRDMIYCDDIARAVLDKLRSKGVL